MHFFEIIVVGLGIITLTGTVIVFCVGSYHAIKSYILKKRMKKIKKLLSYLNINDTDDKNEGIEMTNM
tara:strand:+ start:866 stop:1069 length:204 start_codon:yes stop_codon:yes gene_type:complete